MAESELQVMVDARDADREELAELARQLRAELLQLDVERVDEVVVGEAPPGTRAGDVVALGALLVSLAGQAKLLPALVDTVKGWLGRVGQPSTVKLELDGDVLEVTGASSSQQQQLIEAWLARHTVGPPLQPEGAAGT